MSRYSIGVLFYLSAPRPVSSVQRYMAASSGFMIAEAERRFPVRIRIGVPPNGKPSLPRVVSPDYRKMR